MNPDEIHLLTKLDFQVMHNEITKECVAIIILNDHPFKISYYDAKAYLETDLPNEIRLELVRFIKRCEEIRNGLN